MSTQGGFQIEASLIVTFVAAVLTTLTTTVAVLYRGQLSALKDRIAWLEEELTKRDVREDRLIEQLGRTADGLHRTVSLAQQEIPQRTPRR